MWKLIKGFNGIFECIGRIALLNFLIIVAKVAQGATVSDFGVIYRILVAVGTFSWMLFPTLQYFDKK